MAGLRGRRKMVLDIRRLIDRVEGLPEEVTQSIALRLYGKIQERSPVDTGFFRASWTMGEGRGTPPPPDVASPSIAPRGSVDRASSARAANFVASNPSTTYTIANHLPYAEALENGHSGQARQGVVAVSVAELEADIR